MPNRRDFVRSTAGSLGVLAGSSMLMRPATHRIVQRADAPLKILILGGTGFTGPSMVSYAVQRGHQVSVFNRGKRQTDLPAQVEHLRGDRVTGDLASLKGKRWDVVIDVPTALPRWVRDVGEVMAKSSDRFVFISTISVYGDPKSPPDEKAPVDQWSGTGDPLDVRQFGSAHMAQYGALKALAEREAEKWWPGKTTVIRPGLIVGPRDDIDRFTYWATRIDRGGEILCPGKPSDPVQVIDGRDLAEWTIRMAESGTTGSFNATGPRSPMGFGELLSGIRAAISGDKDVRFTWVDAEFLAEQKVEPWSDMPLWLPPSSESANVSRVDVAKAVAAGLAYRPLAVTARDTIDWFKTMPAERQAKLRAGIAADREAQVLQAWKAKRG